ncbi:MAG: OadG family protein [Clostridiales bacterium]|nr:OadG family protein [Clostridiales bacterium]
MGLFNKKKNKGADDGELAAVIAAGIAASETDEELIAVLSAAVAAYETGSGRQTLHVRKLSRAAAVRPAWGAMGTNEAIDMRRI